MKLSTVALDTSDIILSFMLSVFTLSDAYAECREYAMYAECHYTGCRGARLAGGMT